MWDVKQSERVQKRAEKKATLVKEAKHVAKEKTRLEPFVLFWSGLSSEAQTEFEAQAVKSADSMKFDGYKRSQGEGGSAFEYYRQMILRDQFEQISKTSS